jgi:hypothetical protein
METLCFVSLEGEGVTSILRCCKFYTLSSGVKLDTLLEVDYFKDYASRPYHESYYRDQQVCMWSDFEIW